MRSSQLISSQDVYKYAISMMQSHLSFEDVGPQCQSEKLLEILFYAAAHCSSISKACHDLHKAPSDQAVRNALGSLFVDCESLESELNEVLSQQILRSFKKQRWQLAIDLTLIPYHGHPQEEEEEIYRSQAKQGTTHFHAYATCYLISKPRRFTIALIRVTKGLSMKTVVQRLLQLSSQAGIRPKLF